MSNEELEKLAAAASPGDDVAVAIEALKGMTRRQRREWFCKSLMKKRRLTFRGMASRHRVSAFLLSGAVSGQFRWTPLVIKCLEAELQMALDPFFEDGETRDGGDRKGLDTPQAEK